MADLSGIQLHYVHSIDDMAELKRWMGERRPVLGIDTETAGFDWWRDPLRMVQVGDAMTGWAIPYDDWKGVCKEVLPSYDRPIVFHNFKFDVQFLEWNGVEVPRRHLHDSEVLCHLENASLPKALKSSASRYIDRGFAAGQQKLEEHMATNGWSWATIPVNDPIYWQYAALDPIMTARLWEMFEHHTRMPLYDVEIRSTDVLLRCERKGVRIDEDYCRRTVVKLREYAGQLRAWAREAYGVKNLTSDLEVAARMERDGWEPIVFTKTGRPSLRKEVAQWIDHPLAGAKVECAHAEKMAGAYLENFLEYAVDGRVHAKINPLGARTGRMSISEPSLQNIPRDDVIARDAFIASPGCRLVLCDYDQIEARLMVHFSGAESMVQLFDGRLDFFTGMARQVYRDESIEKSDPRRQRTKTGVYAKMYGAGEAKFAHTIGVTEQEASEFLRALDYAYPEIMGLQREIERVADQRLKEEGVAYVVTPYGRRHPVGFREGTYKLMNYLIQGFAADVLKQKLVEIDAAGLSEFFVLPVHDELDFDVPADLVADAQVTIQQVMPALDFTVPISVGMDVVDRWGDKYRKAS